MRATPPHMASEPEGEHTAKQGHCQVVSRHPLLKACCSGKILHFRKQINAHSYS